VCAFVQQAIIISLLQFAFGSCYRSPLVNPDRVIDENFLDNILYECEGGI